MAVPRFYMYKAPLAAPMSSVIENALKTAHGIQAIKTQQAMTERQRRELEMEEERYPLERKKLEQAIAREEKLLPLDIRKKELEALTEKQKAPYWQQELKRAQAQTGLYGAQERKADIQAKKEEQVMQILKSVMGQGGLGGGSPPAPQTPPQGKMGAPVVPGATGTLDMTATPAPITGSPTTSPEGQTVDPYSYLNPEQQKKLRAADALAIARGQPLPSMQMQANLMAEEAKNEAKYNNALRAQQGKTMAETTVKLAEESKLAQQSIDDLSQLLKYTNAAKIKGPLAKYFSKVAEWDPNYRAAVKSAMQLQLKGIKGLATSKVGRILQRMVETIEKGLPMPDLPPEATKILAKQLKGFNLAVLERNHLFQKYSRFIQDPAALSEALNQLELQHGYIDSKGNVNFDAIKDWEKIATKERMWAEAYPLEFENRAGQGALDIVRNKSTREALPVPSGLSEEDVSTVMNKYGLTRREAINLSKAYKEYLNQK